MAQRGTTYPPPLFKVYEPTLSKEKSIYFTLSMINWIQEMNKNTTVTFYSNIPCFTCISSI